MSTMVSIQLTASLALTDAAMLYVVQIRASVLEAGDDYLPGADCHIIPVKRVSSTLAMQATAQRHDLTHLMGDPMLP